MGVQISCCSSKSQTVKEPNSLRVFPQQTIYYNRNTSKRHEASSASSIVAANAHLREATNDCDTEIPAKEEYARSNEGSALTSANMSRQTKQSAIPVHEKDEEIELVEEDDDEEEDDADDLIGKPQSPAAIAAAAAAGEKASASALSSDEQLENGKYNQEQEGGEEEVIEGRIKQQQTLISQQEQELLEKESGSKTKNERRNSSREKGKLEEDKEEEYDENDSRLHSEPAIMNTEESETSVSSSNNSSAIMSASISSLTTNKSKSSISQNFMVRSARNKRRLTPLRDLNEEESESGSEDDEGVVKSTKKTPQKPLELRFAESDDEIEEEADDDDDDDAEEEDDEKGVQNKLKKQNKKQRKSLGDVANPGDENQDQQEEDGEQNENDDEEEEDEGQEDESEADEDIEEEMFNLQGILYEVPKGNRKAMQKVMGLDSLSGQSYVIKQYSVDQAEELGFDKSLAIKIWRIQRKFGCFCRIKAINVSQEDGGVHIVQDHEKGGSMSLFLETKFTEKEAKLWIIKVLEALSVLHQEGISHGNLKPNNILIDKGVLKLADINMFTNTKHLQSLYSAPEVLLKSTVSQKSDVWSVGLIFIEMLSGRMPFGNRTMEEHKAKIVHTKFKLQYSPDVNHFVQMMCTLAPDKRRSVKELLNCHYLKSEKPQHKSGLTRLLTYSIEQKTGMMLKQQQQQQQQQQMQQSGVTSSARHNFVTKPSLNESLMQEPSINTGRANGQNISKMYSNIFETKAEKGKYGQTSLLSYMTLVNIKDNELQHQESFVPISVANLVTQMTNNNALGMSIAGPSHIPAHAHPNDNLSAIARQDILNSSIISKRSEKPFPSNASLVPISDSKKSLQKKPSSSQIERKGRNRLRGTKIELQSEESVDVRKKKYEHSQNQYLQILNKNNDQSDDEEGDDDDEDEDEEDYDDDDQEGGEENTNKKDQKRGEELNHSIDEELRKKQREIEKQLEDIFNQDNADDNNSSTILNNPHNDDGTRNQLDNNSNISNILENGTRNRQNINRHSLDALNSSLNGSFAVVNLPRNTEQLSKEAAILEEMNRILAGDNNPLESNHHLRRNSSFSIKSGTSRDSIPRKSQLQQQFAQHSGEEKEGKGKKSGESENESDILRQMEAILNGNVSATNNLNQSYQSENGQENPNRSFVSKTPSQLILEEMNRIMDKSFASSGIDVGSSNNAIEFDHPPCFMYKRSDQQKQEIDFNLNGQQQKQQEIDALARMASILGQSINDSRDSFNNSFEDNAKEADKSKKQTKEGQEDDDNPFDLEKMKKKSNRLSVPRNRKNSNESNNSHSDNDIKNLGNTIVLKKEVSSASSTKQVPIIPNLVTVSSHMLKSASMLKSLNSLDIIQSSTVLGINGQTIAAAAVTTTTSPEAGAIGTVVLIDGVPDHCIVPIDNLQGMLVSIKPFVSQIIVDPDNGGEKLQQSAGFTKQKSIKKQQSNTYKAEYVKKDSARSSLALISRNSIEIASNATGALVAAEAETETVVQHIPLQQASQQLSGEFINMVTANTFSNQQMTSNNTGRAVNQQPLRQMTELFSPNPITTRNGAGGENHFNIKKSILDYDDSSKSDDSSASGARNQSRTTPNNRNNLEEVVNQFELDPVGKEKSQSKKDNSVAAVSVGVMKKNMAQTNKYGEQVDLLIQNEKASTPNQIRQEQRQQQYVVSIGREGEGQLLFDDNDNGDALYSDRENGDNLSPNLLTIQSHIVEE